MGDPQTPDPKPSPPSKIHSAAAGGAFPNYPNPPESANPDAATLREQWRFAIRQYSKWYSHAWGTAILAGVSFFALGWVIKGGNPLPSFNSDGGASGKNKSSSGGGKDEAAAAAAEVNQPPR